MGKRERWERGGQGNDGVAWGRGNFDEQDLDGVTQIIKKKKKWMKRRSKKEEASPEALKKTSSQGIKRVPRGKMEKEGDPWKKSEGKGLGKRRRLPVAAHRKDRGFSKRGIVARKKSMVRDGVNTIEKFAKDQGKVEGGNAPTSSGA